MNSERTQLLLERLVRSKLLEESQLRLARRIVRSQPTAEHAAVELVRQSLLTRWQARQLLSGKKTKFFLGKYKLLKLIGTGAMGSVFKAFHPTMNRVVALKVMSREILHDRLSIARFQREIRAAAMLDHPHIVRALDADQVRNTYFLVMEHIDGKDLRHWIKTAAPLPIAWSCECIRQAAEGLQHAHEQGIVHRDLKPSNLIVCGKTFSPHPVVKLVDFGLAQVAQEDPNEMKLTRVGRTVGTFAYMAPEQTRNSRLDIRADIFSLGCTMFQMISGKIPFQGNSEVEILKLRLEQDAPPLSRFRPEVAPALDRLVSRMLARDPDQRFPTPAALAQALIPFAQGHEDLPSRFQRAAVELEAAPTNAGTSETTDPSFDSFLQSIPEEITRRVASNHPKPIRKNPLWKIAWKKKWWMWMIAVFGLLLGFACWNWGR